MKLLVFKLQESNIFTLVIDNLRTATRNAHRDLDHFLVPIIKGVASREDYQYLMSMFYAFYQPLEKDFTLFLASSQVVPDFRDRRKSSLIIEDLASVTLSYEKPPVTPSIPQVKSVSAALGCYYVYEGSSMGGMIIRQMLSSVPGLQNGLRFLSAYGDNNQFMWNKFLSNVGEHEARLDEAAMTAAALDTFKKLYNWSKEYYGHKHTELTRS